MKIKVGDLKKLIKEAANSDNINVEFYAEEPSEFGGDWYEHTFVANLDAPVYRGQPEIQVVSVTDITDDNEKVYSEDEFEALMKSWGEEVPDWGTLYDEYWSKRAESY